MGTTTLGFSSPARSERAAAWLGLALGVAFATCFLTGLWSHLQQHPPGWFDPPARPAGLYRLSQGLHVATGAASIPLLLIKLWVAFPHLVARPVVRSPLHAVERAALLPLVGGSLFLVLSGTANVARWYPWSFQFPRAHYWVAWITIGGMVVHLGAKGAATSRLVRRPADSGDPDRPTEPDPETERLAAERRWLLATAAAAAGTAVVATIGGTFTPFGSFSVLAQRRPGVGPQGIPVNRTAAAAGIDVDAISSTYRLIVDGDVARRLELTLADIDSLEWRSATLPIACVEGWSASARWTGVPVRVLLDMAGVDRSATVIVHSLQTRGSYRTSEIGPSQWHDADTLLARRIGAEELHPDHGYPVRLIGPARPGVMQTKWVERLEVR